MDQVLDLLKSIHMDGFDVIAEKWKIVKQMIFSLL